jgi:ribonuclease HI
MEVHIYTDGGSRGNPGPAASGAVIKTPEGEVLAEVKKYLGETTNNQAEYVAIIIGLAKAKELGATRAKMFMDTQLAVRQLNGEYKVKNPGIAQRFKEVHDVSMGFERVTFEHVRRELNKEADALVNQCLDEELG